jgi:hypothetical protein
MRPFSLSAAMVAGQVGLVSIGLSFMAFAAPARGEMLLVPLSAGARDHMAAAVIAEGALLVGNGPIAGTMVVRGERGRIAAPMWRRGVLVVAAPALTCGERAGAPL